MFDKDIKNNKNVKNKKNIKNNKNNKNVKNKKNNKNNKNNKNVKNKKNVKNNINIKSNKFKVLRILNLMSVVFIIICLIYIGRWGWDNYTSINSAKELKEYVSVQNTVGIENEELKEYKIDFEKLRKENPDTVGWLKVNNTNIDYPIVSAKNNSYYLNHDFNKKKNKTGWLWINCLNKLDGEDKNIVIYGHNMHTGAMFGTLKNILKPEWYNNKENEHITFTTESETQIYKVFSIYQIEAENYYIKNDFNTKKAFEEFVDTLKQRSVKKYDIDIESKDFKIMTLSTCADDSNYRVVLHAVRIK